jgi:hypothetical protein
MCSFSSSLLDFFVTLSTTICATSDFLTGVGKSRLEVNISASCHR